MKLEQQLNLRRTQSRSNSRSGCNRGAVETVRPYDLSTCVSHGNVGRESEAELASDSNGVHGGALVE